MKRIFTKVICVLLVSALALISAAGCKPKEERVVYVCNWGEYMDESLNDEFTEKTGIRVVYSYFDTNEALYALMKGGTSSYDVIVPSDYMIGRMIEEDMLEKLDFSKIPNYVNIDELYKDLPFDPNNEYSIPYLWGTLGIIYNTTMVNGEINSWNALWDEQYAGDILMIDNPRDGIAIALMRLGFSLNTTDETELLGAENELKKQKPLLQAYVMDQSYNKMEGGSAALCAYYSGDAMSMAQENEDLAFVVPEEGSNWYVDSLCIPKGARNTDEAHEYINFMLEAESGLRNCEEAGGSTPNKETFKLLDFDEKIMALMYPSGEVLSRCEMFSAMPTNINKLYDDIWAGVKQ